MLVCPRCDQADPRSRTPALDNGRRRPRLPRTAASGWRSKVDDQPPARALPRTRWSPRCARVRLRQPDAGPAPRQDRGQHRPGRGLTNAKAIDAAVGDLTTITGQKPIVTRAKRSIAQFRLRTGMPIGAKVTLRGQRMYDFLERLTIAGPAPHPRLPGRARAIVRRARQLQPRVPRAARVPRDRLRQDRPSARAGDQHRDHRADRRGSRSACSSCWACRSPPSAGKEIAWPRNR